MRLTTLPGGLLLAEDITPAQRTVLERLDQAQWSSDRHGFVVSPVPDTISALRALSATGGVDATADAVELLRVYGRAEFQGDPVHGYTLNIPAGPIVKDLRRIPGVVWDTHGNVWRIPAEQYPKAEKVAHTWGVPAVHATPATVEPLVFDGTLEGLFALPLSDLGVSPALMSKLAPMGICSVGDALTTYPYRYLDRSAPQFIRTLRAGDEGAVIGVLSGLQPGPRRGMVKGTVSDASGRMSLSWFSSPWLLRQFRNGDEVIVMGPVTQWRDSLQFTNPVIEAVAEDPAPVLGIYPASAKHGVTTWQVRALARTVLDRVTASGGLVDPFRPWLPDTIPGLWEAFRGIHDPHDLGHAERCRRRLAFDELFTMQVSIAVNRTGENQGVPFTHPGVDAVDLVDLANQACGFSLTEFQVHAVNEIAERMRAPSAMRVLLQGDVGSGKTSIAITAALIASQAGGQVVVLAPTELLACQLYDGFRAADERLDGLLGTVLVTGRMTTATRRETYAQISSGSSRVIVGTHAVLTADVPYSNVSLVIVDEQHRFGVEQRATLLDRNPGRIPDLLVMTATPIPRTAALTAYGDLDQVVIAGLPPGRTPIRTVWLDESADTATPLGVNPTAAWAVIHDQVRSGRQGYVITPLVEESEKLQAASAIETCRQLQEGPLAGLRLETLHGRQSVTERDRIMSDFHAGTIDVLVATTVVEVGVNVPNASVIVILDPARFGIAQLHQLRGRVGRAHHASTCLLVGQAPGQDARERCLALVESTDGFILAQRDLEIRGPGNLLGAQQAGRMVGLRATDFTRDEKVLAFARQTAQQLTDNDPTLSAYPAVRARIASTLSEQAQAWLSAS